MGRDAPLGRGSRKGSAPITAPAFREWAAAAYARPGAERALLTLQDAHRMNVNLVLWSLWAGAHFADADGAALKAAIALGDAWEASVVAPLRTVRRSLKRGVAGIVDEPLRDQIKRAELAAEGALQQRLDALARPLPAAPPDSDCESRARRCLGAYARAARAGETQGFSISLLEAVIGLLVDPQIRG